MATWIAFGLTGIALLWAFLVWRGSARLKRAEFIRTYTLPQGLYDKVRERRPELTYKDCALVARGLRQFFLAYLNSGRRFVSMPSQIVDELWHEFILYTREYERFCRQAFGGFLHHRPAVVLGSEKLSNEGLRRVWWHACKEDNIHPGKPSRLPLLFALDSKLKIANGFHYEPDCRRARRTNEKVAGATPTYCGGDFSLAAVDGCLDGFGDAAPGYSSDFVPSFSDIGSGGGCGGSGCGGGGCGGGGD